MIFVTLGIEQFPFDRLVKEVDFLARVKKINAPVFIQLGACKYEPVHCEWKRFLPFGEMCKRIEEADLVIAHAGAGTTLLCLQLGKRPILVPRRKKFKEQVGDHQVMFAKKMQELGYASVAFEISELANLINTHVNKEFPKNSAKSESSELIKYLKNLLISWEKK